MSKTKLFKKSTKGAVKKTDKTKTDGPGKGHLRGQDRIDRKKLKGVSEVSVRFANLLHAERQKRSATTREISKLFKMHNSYYGKIETAGVEVKLGTALGLLKKLNLPISALEPVLAAV